MADTPMKEWGEGIGDGFGHGLLIPTLAAFGAVARAGHDDAIIADGGFALADAGDCEEFLAEALALGDEGVFHGFYFDLAGAPAKCVVVWRGDASPKYIREKAFFNGSGDGFDVDASFA